MRTAQIEHLDRIIDFVKRKEANDLSLSDVVSLAEITAESLSAFYASMDKVIFTELKAIAEYIQSMRREIGALQAKDLQESHIPSAGMELDAIVKATESATNSIMECAETVMAADHSDSEGFKAIVDDKMMQIFEACSFQDITGQRVAKVVDTLKAIEARVTRFTEAVKVDQPEFEYVSEEEKEREERKKNLLLNGPQLAGQGVNQGDVDALLNGGSAQDNIDALFD